MATSGRWKITQAPNLLERIKLKEELRELMQQLGSSGKVWWLEHFEITQEAPDAIAVIEEGYTNIANNLDCATDLIHVVSSDAADDKDGAGAQAVRIWYLQDDSVKHVDYDLEGITHVHLAALGTIDRLQGMEIVASQNAAVPAIVAPTGNITIDVHATGTVYCTIPAGSLHSLTTKAWIPEGYQGACVSLVPKFEIANGAAPVFANGTNIALDVNATLTNIQGIPPELNGQDVVNPQPYSLPLDGEAYLGVAHETLDTDANLTETIDVMYLIWEV